MRLRKYISIALIGLGLAIATGFATVFFTTFTTIFGGTSTAIENCQYRPEVYEGLDSGQLVQELRQNGLVGRIHGTIADAKMAVLSVRDPNNFFDQREFSILSNNLKAEAILEQVHRHDLVCVQGRILDNPSPQSHVLVESMRVIESWTGLDDYPDYEYEAGVPDELLNQTQLVGTVHAIGAEGRVLVMEYKDRVLPVFVRSPDLTQSLYRGDIVQLSYQVQGQPGRPIHLQLDNQAEQPLVVLDAIAQWHEQPKTLSGPLVKFPQSPQIRFDVYAIEVDTDGIQRTFTLVNFEDADTFQQIRDDLADVWQRHESTAVNGRNMLINPDVIVQATGTVNVISPEQANPQILLDGADALQVLE